MSSPARKVKRMTGPRLWAIALVIVGVVLLLDNFLLLGDFNAIALLPLLLVVVGAQVLLRGDLIPNADARTFGITRGSVESATLEISSGEIDVEIRPLSREGRLIAGQFAGESRPYLKVQDNYAHLKMDRSRTPWFSFVDWQAGLARDLPWQLFISTHLGQVNCDLSGLIMRDVVTATGVGDIRFVCPQEALGQIYLRSTLGNIHLITPPGIRSRIVARGGRMFKVRHDAYRYENPEPHVYVSTDADADAPVIEIQISGSFGDAYLA